MPRHSEVMGNLKSKINEISRFIPADRDVVFLDYPVYLNIGDLLIAAGTKSFFKANGYNVVNEFSLLEQADCLKHIKPDQTLVMQGGGNFGDLWAGHQDFRLWVIENFPNNKIVILPQSLHFSGPDKLAETLVKLDKHNDLTICVRDEVSEGMLKPLARVKLHLSPDMAHHLWGSSCFPRNNPTLTEPLLFIRRDEEGAEQVEIYKNYDKNLMIDWPEIIKPSSLKIYNLIRRYVYKTNHPVLKCLPKALIWNCFANYLICKCIRYFSKYPSVVTDRLHGTILTLLMQKPITLIDSGSGKLTRYANCWLKDSPLLTIKTFK